MTEFEDHGITGGVWSGRLTASERPARICVACLGEVVAEGSVAGRDDGGWDVSAKVPAAVIANGVTTLILVADSDTAAGTHTGPASIHLARLTLAAGKPLDDDAAAEIATLRAELELLKREFRRFAANRQD